MSTESILATLPGEPCERIPGGGLLIGKLPPRPDGLFGRAFLHSIYSPLSKQELDLLAEAVGKPIPAELGDFYLKANGMHLFCSSISISGLRLSLSRDPNVRLPVSLQYGNVLDPLEVVDDRFSDQASWLCFGFYSDGAGRQLLIDTNDGPRSKVYLTPRFQAGPVLYSWSSFEEFLSSEVSRLSSLLSTRGGNIDPLNPLPPPV